MGLDSFASPGLETSIECATPERPVVDVEVDIHPMWTCSANCMPETAIYNMQVVNAGSAVLLTHISALF